MGFRDRTTRDAVADIAQLLAIAYQRYRRARQSRLPLNMRPNPSTENLITRARRAKMRVRLTHEEDAPRADRRAGLRPAQTAVATIQPDHDPRLPTAVQVAQRHRPGTSRAQNGDGKRCHGKQNQLKVQPLVLRQALQRMGRFWMLVVASS